MQSQPVIPNEEPSSESFENYYHRQFDKPLPENAALNYFLNEGDRHRKQKAKGGPHSQHRHLISADGKKYLRNTMVLNTDGSSADQDKGHIGSEATYAVFRGHGNKDNRSGLVPLNYGVTNNTAELFAVKIAVEEIKEIMLNKISLNVFIIATDSTGVMGLLNTKKKKELRRNNYHKKLHNHRNHSSLSDGTRSLLRSIDMSIMDIEEMGGKVLFWWIPRRCNRAADKLANEAHSKKAHHPSHRPQSPPHDKAVHGNPHHGHPRKPPRGEHSKNRKPNHAKPHKDTHEKSAHGKLDRKKAHHGHPSTPQSPPESPPQYLIAWDKFKQQMMPYFL